MANFCLIWCSQYCIQLIFLKPWCFQSYLKLWYYYNNYKLYYCELIILRNIIVTLTYFILYMLPSLSADIARGWRLERTRRRSVWQTKLKKAAREAGRVAVGAREKSSSWSLADTAECPYTQTAPRLSLFSPMTSSHKRQDASSSHILQVSWFFSSSSASIFLLRNWRKERRQNQPSDPFLPLVSRHHYCPPNRTPPYPRRAIVLSFNLASTPAQVPIPLFFHAKDFLSLCFPF